MSGSPTREGVAQVRETLVNLRTLNEESAALQLQIRAATLRLNEIETELREDKAVLRRRLGAMDLTASGNVGYEFRMAWFLEELIAQAVTPNTKTAPQAVAPYTVTEPQGGSNG